MGQGILHVILNNGHFVDQKRLAIGKPHIKAYALLVDVDRSVSIITQGIHDL